ncbi:hypothetical protein C8N46_10570 [Kordia periserrulae]|uniref:UbiA prenyltransferase family protein n=1 Tax=Kordia periserrulae TaxID=701523 RepID=A0A2T6BXV5_9FLAO|nr:hypothetical protein [Kordia periserrulae]PTX60914.1 hypothetical protein C8N46_10570 [Kordia periserrulae]
MNVFKRLFDFYLDSSIHIGLSVYALTYTTLIFFKMPYDEAVLYFTFYSTIVTYNFIKYGSSAKQYFFVATRYLRYIQILSFVCFVLACYYALQLQLKTLFVAVGLGLLSTLYILPFLPKQKNLRTLPGYKIAVVALCWTGVTVVLPLLNADVSLVETNVFLLCLQRFLLILILMIPFEISDMSYDDAALGTLPQRLGILQTKRLAYVWILLFIVLEFYLRNAFSVAFFIAAGIGLLLIVSIWQSRIKKSKYFTAFWVESIPIVWFLLLLLCT